MKILTHYEQLVGKTIAFAHMAQFADQITIATTDKEVLMATFDLYDEDDAEIRVLKEPHVFRAIRNSTYLQRQLDILGIFNLEEYQKEQEKQRKEMIEREKAQREEREKREYERLKAKFEKQ